MKDVIKIFAGLAAIGGGLFLMKKAYNHEEELTDSEFVATPEEGGNYSVDSVDVEKPKSTKSHVVIRRDVLTIVAVTGGMWLYLSGFAKGNKQAKDRLQPRVDELIERYNTCTDHANELIQKLDIAEDTIAVLVSEKMEAKHGNKN